MPTAEQAHEVTQNVTFMFKSFERQKQAKKLYKNIQKHYPGAKVVIADDSKVPLGIKNKTQSAYRNSYAVQQWTQQGA